MYLIGTDANDVVNRCTRHGLSTQFVYVVSETTTAETFPAFRPVGVICHDISNSTDRNASALQNDKKLTLT